MLTHFNIEMSINFERENIFHKKHFHFIQLSMKSLSSSLKQLVFMKIEINIPFQDKINLIRSKVLKLRIGRIAHSFLCAFRDLHKQAFNKI